MSDDAVIQGHEQILEHTIGLFRSFPIPPGVNLELFLRTFTRGAGHDRQSRRIGDHPTSSKGRLGCRVHNRMRSGRSTSR
jgi:hypothetical protein